MKSHLIVIQWNRWSEPFDKMIKCSFSIECDESEIADIIRKRQELCDSEGYGRKITNIHVYRLENTINE
jgi:hypothetical protein